MRPSIRIQGVPVDAGSYLDRIGGESTFEIEAVIGKRMDTATIPLHDPDGLLAIPPRAQIVIYDADVGSAVVDPPAVAAATGDAEGSMTLGDASVLTPRLFAGFCAAPTYKMVGAERALSLTAQDYTYRLSTTVANRAFEAGFSDSYIIRQVMKQYRPEIDTTDVQTLVPGLPVSAPGSMPAMSFPVHTLEQFLNRVTQISQGQYYVDYNRRMHYGAAASRPGPFNLSANTVDIEDGSAGWEGFEDMSYTPDAGGLINKLWVIGSKFLSGITTYSVPPAQVDGNTRQFPLSGTPAEAKYFHVYVGGVDQGPVGWVPTQGQPEDVSTWSPGYEALIQGNPPFVILKTNPLAGVAVTVTGLFYFPLIEIVTGDLSLSQGNVFEGVLREKRIDSKQLAQQAGQAYLNHNGKSFKGGGCTIRRRGLQPGQLIKIRHPKLFAGFAEADRQGTINAVINRVQITLDDDSVQPYRVELTFADRRET